VQWRIEWKDTVSSVMDELKAAAGHGAGEWLVCAAKRQSEGRGRLGRVWASPPGGLYAAVLLRPDCPVSEAGRVTIMAGAAVCEAIRDYAGVDGRIKWPNDILVFGKKVAGILTESGIRGASLEYLVLGIGVNVNTHPSDLPPGAVSLRQLSGQQYDLNAFLQKILERVFYWSTRMRQQGFPPVRDQWISMCVSWEKPIQFEYHGRKCRGRAVDLSDDGGLMIRCDDGEIVRWISGEIHQ